MKTKAVYLTTDTRSLRESIERYSTRLDDYNSILAAYNAMNLAALTKDEFISLVRDPASLIFDKMTKGEEVSIAGLKVDKTKAMDILTKPDGYNNLLALIGNAKKNADCICNLPYIDVTDGEIVLSESFIEKETERHKIYAETENEKNVAAFAQTVLDTFKKQFGDNVNPGWLRPIFDEVIIDMWQHTHLKDRSSKINYKSIKNWGGPGWYPQRKD